MSWSSPTKRAFAPRIPCGESAGGCAFRARSNFRSAPSAGRVSPAASAASTSGLGSVATLGA
eukprot:7850991-Pyramimonas_sp.AAC.1